MQVRHARRWPLALCGGLGGLLAGLAVAVAAPDRNDGAAGQPAGQAESPIPSTPTPFSVADRDRRLVEKAMTAGSPVMLRIFKAESELELWLLKEGRFELFAIYPICYRSGTLGPKVREGDRQAPEGFYTVGTEQLRLKGRHARSLDLGYPNALDRSHARTGSHILVHGGCQSIGCYAMTNPVMEEIFALSEQALRQGQDRIQVHVFPFRMTEANLAAHADNAWHGFWLNLKDAHDVFERTHIPPRVGVCEKKYIVREGVVPWESAAPAGTTAWSALTDCERDEAEAALWQAPPAVGAMLRATNAGGVAFRQGSHRYAGRNVRKAYAAARRSRTAAYASGRRRAH